MPPLIAVADRVLEKSLHYASNLACCCSTSSVKAATWLTGPQRIVDLAATLDVTSSIAGRMDDRLYRRGMVRRYRARADRRELVVSVTGQGRDVVGKVTARRCELLAEILGRLRHPVRISSASRPPDSAAGPGLVAPGQMERR
jgi:hypothetical protein